MLAASADCTEAASLLLEKGATLELQVRNRALEDNSVLSCTFHAICATHEMKQNTTNQAV